ncbi:20583_t:CDS:1, partial [Funneliformis geosporum]
EEFLGAGIPGIVDKLVCMDADYFLATPEEPTAMIINTRKASKKLGDKPQLKKYR